jgi:predicted ATPase
MSEKNCCYEFGPFRLDSDKRLLTREGSTVRLFPQVFDVLVFLMENASRTVTKEDLLKSVWAGTVVTDKSFSQAVSKLRKALGDEGEPKRYIKTIPKRGYRFVAEVREIKPTAFLPPTADLVPRPNEVHLLVEELNQNRVTTIIAPTGYGKTSLATLVASEVQETFRDGLWFVAFEDLGEKANQTAVVEAISSVLGETTEHQTVGALARLIQRQNLLLILDACEAVPVDWEAIISVLVLKCPYAKVLATSRHPLGVSGECLHILGALPLPDERLEDAAVLDEFLCASMFRRTADRSGCSLSRDAMTTSRIASICRLAEGVPLIIELTASMTYHDSLEEIADGLRSDFQMDKGQGDRLNRRLLRSYRLLSDPAKTLFKKLSVFRGSFTKAAAKAIWDLNSQTKSEAPIQELVESSLLSRSGSRRYRMLDSTRSFAISLPWAEGEEEALSRSHLNFFHGVAERLAKQVLERDVCPALDEMQEESPNMQRAVEWALQSAPADGTALCGALWPYWVVAGQLTEGRAMLKAFLAAAQECPPPVLARAWTGLGVLAYFQSEYEEGIRFCDKGLELATEVSDRWAVCVNLIAGGGMRFTTGQYEAAFHHFDESVGLANQLGGPWLRSLATGNAAMYRAAFVSKNPEGSNEQNILDVLGSAEKSVSLGRQSENPWVLAFALMNQGMAIRFLSGARERDHYESLIREAFDLRYTIKDKYGMIQSLFELSMVACERGTKEEFVRTAVLLGGVQRLIAGRERIPIPKHNEPFYRWTIDTCSTNLGEDEYQSQFEKGMTLSLTEINDLLGPVRRTT